MSSSRAGNAPSIWWFAFGYFACYVPYSATTKALTSGSMSAGTVTGFQILPVSVMASVVGMLIFLTSMKWWRFATQRQVFGLTLPSPGRYTFLSGLCTAAIIATTTLAYTFEGVSIVFVMLLMRGGVLIIAPMVDALSKRPVRWFSWIGLALSMGALLVAFSEDGGYDISVLCAIDVAVYLASYFVRLRFMSRLAKSDDAHATFRYFVEEHMVGAPAVLLALFLWAFLGNGSFADELMWGFTEIFSSPVLPYAIVIGLLSEGTGVFGGLVLLDSRENTFCVPVNRSSSIMAGVVASFTLAVLVDRPLPSVYQLTGAVLIVVAILFLSLPPLLEKKRA